MSHIDTVKGIVDKQKLFNDERGATYVRLMDTPRIWGEDFGEGIMGKALARTKEFEVAILEIIQKTKYRCDVASLNSPDPSWTKIVLEGMDRALSTPMGRDRPTQFRFLFGQTPMILTTGTPPNLIDFQGSLIRLVRARWRFWERMPEIWLGKFFRLQVGIVSGLGSYIKSTIKEYTPTVIADALMSDDEDDASTKMTWNHSKIIASDGIEALVGGHNLNMDLFTSYPPVHDVSVIVHGGAAYGSQLYLNQMWECKSNILTKDWLDTSDIDAPAFKGLSDDNAAAQDRRPLDPLADVAAEDHREARYTELAEVHGGSVATEPVVKGSSRKGSSTGSSKDEVLDEAFDEAKAIRAEDLQTFIDLDAPLFEDTESTVSYDKLSEYKRATRILSVGKYWTGPNLSRDYKAASELMKESLIMGAQHTLKLSQMDLISAWKKSWQSHVVCHWIMRALRQNPELVVQVVVSPLNAGAGAEGDQYSFGSGARRTFELFQYYSKYDIDDKPSKDAVEKLIALERLHIAPLFFTAVADEDAIEGESYFWPDLDETKGWTQTIRQPTLLERVPKRGVIGDAVEAVKMASGKSSKYKKVPSAPGNHAKIMIVDDESYVVGSDNLYPGFLSEFNYLIEGEEAVGELLQAYWNPLWHYSSQHCVNPFCKKGCKAKDSAYLPSESKPKPKPRGAALRGLQGVPDVPLLDVRDAGRVKRIAFGALEEPELPKKKVDKGSSSESHSKDEVVQASSEEVSKEEKEKRARLAKGLGPFLADDDLPDLRAPGYNFTESDIYNLQRYYLRASPSIAVIEGVSSFQWKEMNRLAYTTDIHPAITTLTDTIIQAYHVGENHWALLYITLGPAGHDGVRPAKLLYIDPLNPNAVPVDRLALLRQPFPGLQAEHSLVEYQDDNSFYGQNSCGAWVVYLARQIAQNPHRLPEPDDDKHEAALALRVSMNRDLAAAHAHPRPVAPDDQRLWVQAPL